MKPTRRYNAFSLIELVIVVVIVAIMGGIVIPKMSRGAAAANDSALIQDLTMLRQAIDLYQSENGGIFPKAHNISDALTTYNDGSGNLSPTKSTVFVNGPYLQNIPAMPVGANKGMTGIKTSRSTATGIGWLYRPSTGQIVANTTVEKDAAGTLYSSY